MILLDLVAQGVKGLPPALRAQLKPGYTLFASSGEGRLWPALEALCFSDAKAGVGANFGAPGAPVARLGSTFSGRDGVVYRLIREANGPGSLSRQDPASGKFSTVSQDASEIVQFLRAQLGLPTRAQYEAAFALSPSQWPSRRPARPTPAAASASRQTAPRANPGPVGLASQMMAEVRPVGDVAAARSQLEILKHELVGTKEADQVQFELDGANRRAYEAGQKVKVDTALKAEVEEARAQAKSVPTPEDLGLPANVGERAARVEGMEKSRDDQLARLDREREQFLGEEHPSKPLQLNPELWVGIGVGVLSLVLGIVLGKAWRYLSLIDIGAFGYAGVIALKWVGALQHNDGRQRRKNHYDEREKQIRDAFDNEMMSIRTAMKLLKVESTDELVEILGRRQVLEARIRDGTVRLNALDADPEQIQARQELEAAQADTARLDARITELSSYSRPAYQVEREIEALEASIEATVNPRDPAATEPASTPALGPSAEDPAEGLLDLVTDLFQLDVAALGALLAPRASQYLMALSDRRFNGLELSPLGAAQVVTASGPAPASTLGAPDRDLVFLALRLTLMEKYAERQKIPLIFDDPFSSLDAAKQVLLGRMLKQLGARTQILHVSTSNATQSLADTTINLA